MSLQGNPFLDCHSEIDQEKNELSLDVCSIKGTHLFSPDNVIPPFEHMITSSQTSQFMQMFEFQNSASFNQGAANLTSQKPKLRLSEKDEIADQSTQLSKENPITDFAPFDLHPIAVDRTDFDVVSEKHEPRQKKTLFKP